MPSSKHDSRTPIGAGLAPDEARRALHHSYALLSRLFLTGPQPALLAHIQATPGLGEQLPQPLDWDELAAAHYALFGFSLHPYEGIFLDSSGLLGGAHAEAVLRHYQAAGYGPDTASDGPDHLGHELGFLAYLCRTEGDAPAAKDNFLARRFMEQHLLRWLPAFVIALSRQARPFYAVLGEWTLRVVALHYGELLAQADEGPGIVPPLPEAPELLADEKTGLKDIGRFLTTPPFSGMYLGKEEVSRLGRQLDLPRGFGDRQQMMVNLLRTAAQYGRMADLLRTLGNIAGEWRGAYEQMMQDEPVLAPFAAVWRKRASLAGELIAGLGATADMAGETARR